MRGHQYEQGWRAARRWCIAWLNDRANNEPDWHAKSTLTFAANDLGNQAPRKEIPVDENEEADKTSQDELIVSRSRQEREGRQLLLAAQRMANAAQARAEKLQELNQSLVDKYFKLMMEKQQKADPTPGKREVVVIALTISVGVFIGCTLSWLVCWFMFWR